MDGSEIASKELVSSSSFLLSNTQQSQKIALFLKRTGFILMGCGILAGGTGSSILVSSIYLKLFILSVAIKNVAIVLAVSGGGFLVLGVIAVIFVCSSSCCNSSGKVEKEKPFLNSLDEKKEMKKVTDEVTTKTPPKDDNLLEKKRLFQALQEISKFKGKKQIDKRDEIEKKFEKDLEKQFQKVSQDATQLQQLVKNVLSIAEDLQEQSKNWNQNVNETWRTITVILKRKVIAQIKDDQQRDSAYRQLITFYKKISVNQQKKDEKIDYLVIFAVNTVIQLSKEEEKIKELIAIKRELLKIESDVQQVIKVIQMIPDKEKQDEELVQVVTDYKNKNDKDHLLSAIEVAKIILDDQKQAKQLTSIIQELRNNKWIDSSEMRSFIKDIRSGGQRDQFCKEIVKKVMKLYNNPKKKEDQKNRLLMRACKFIDICSKGTKEKKLEKFAGYLIAFNTTKEKALKIVGQHLKEEEYLTLKTSLKNYIERIKNEDPRI